MVGGSNLMAKTQNLMAKTLNFKYILNVDVKKN